MEKTGRNDPCPCGSGKKFKKCCEALTPRKRQIKAELIDAQSAPQIHKTIALSSLFQTHLSATPKKPLPPELSPVEPIVLEKNEENLLS